MVNLCLQSRKITYVNHSIPPAPAPLDAVNVFFGGDVWHSLTRQVGGTPIALFAQAYNKSLLKAGIKTCNIMLNL